MSHSDSQASSHPASTAVAGFQRVFGATPQWGAHAPGRVNLIGEHTDYNEGFVLPIAIDRVCACVGSPLANGNIHGQLCSFPIDSDAEGRHTQPLTVKIDWDALRSQGPACTDSLAPADRWAAYVLGVIELFRREAEQRGKPVPPPMNIAVTSSVPLGSGLSSSASLEVAVCTMLEQAAGWSLSKLEKAKLCQRAEHEYAHVPCGIMDQYASVFGEAGNALFLDCRFNTHEPVALPPADDTGAVIVVVNSNVRHELAGGEYAKRRQSCQDAIAEVGVQSMRDIDWYDEGTQDILQELPQNEYDAVMHVASENVRTRHVTERSAKVVQGRTTWKRALPEIGSLMLKSHESLRDLYKVSCAELDALVEIASAVRGVYGARMTGGGLGGCIIALVRPKHLDDLRHALDTHYPQRTGKSGTLFVVQASDGAKPFDPRQFTKS
jgi:galactokinase